MKKSTLLLAASALIFASSAVQAQDNSSSSMVNFAVGYYDVFDNEEAADFRVEYRHGVPCLFAIKPFVGLEATSDGAVYALGGLYGDIPVTDQWVITPSIGAGLYGDGDGKDLGHIVEFRSQLEVGYNFDGGSRMAVGLSHTSNASLDDTNPGTEVLTLNYMMPLHRVVGGN